MSYGTFTTIGLIGLIVAAALWNVTIKTKQYTMRYTLENIQDLYNFFPKKINEITALKNQALKEAEHAVEELINRPAEQRTRENTLYGFDVALAHFKQALALLEVYMLVCPDDALRTHSEKESIFLQQKFIDLFGQNKKLYNVMKEFYEAHKNSTDLTPQEKYYLKELCLDYERNGLSLPDEQHKKVVALQKELAELSTEFEKNIATDTTSITATLEELDGLDSALIQSLKKAEDGQYILGTDYPTYFAVRSFAKNSNTRKKMYEAFNNRAYPVNKPLLEKIVQKRHQLAQLLGFKTFAELSLASEMVQSPERAHAFLTDLLEKINKKETLEYKDLIQALPDSVKLSDKEKFYPWDKMYAIEQYKKTHYNLDEKEVSNYFPVDKTLDELLSIYQQFLDIQFKEETPSGFWHPDVRLISVYNNNQLAGYLLLDLFPRPNKYSHACQATIIPAQTTAQGTVTPALAVVIANFPKATPSQPALLLRQNVTTFFHEFGHALHALLGATKLATASGTNVKTDFVEMPSQMLEEWLHNKEILKKVSSHYKTGEPLSDDVIDTIINLKNLSTGNDLQRQVLFALLSLTLFNETASSDIDALYKKLSQLTLIHDEFDPVIHFYTSFGHLTNYGAKYYSYLWSKVFALDLFETIQKIGLLNPTIGVKYKDTVLAPGGSKDPNEILKDFLGREPNNKAFMKDLGL